MSKIIFRSIAKSPSDLKKLGITHIINAAEGEDDGGHVRANPRMYRRVGIEYYGIAATDYMNFKMNQYFEIASDYIDDVLKKGGMKSHFKIKDTSGVLIK